MTDILKASKRNIVNTSSSVSTTLENIKNFNSSNYLKGVESYFFKLGTYESKDSIKKTIDWLSKFI